MGAFIVVIGRKEEADVLPANQEVSGAALFEMDLKEGPGSVDRSTQRWPPWGGAEAGKSSAVWLGCLGGVK